MEFKEKNLPQESAVDKNNQEKESDPREELMDKMQEIENVWGGTIALVQEMGLKLDHPEWFVVLQGRLDPAKYWSDKLWGTSFLKAGANAVITFLNTFSEGFNHVVEDILIKAHNAGINETNDPEFKRLLDGIQTNKSDILKKINEFKKISIKLQT